MSMVNLIFINMNSNAPLGEQGGGNLSVQGMGSGDVRPPSPLRSSPTNKNMNVSTIFQSQKMQIYTVECAG